MKDKMYPIPLLYNWSVKMLSFYLSLVETEEERDLVTRLFNLYERKMYVIAYGILNNKQDAEDAVSESFIKLINNLDKISDINSSKCKGFITIVVKNTAIDIYNKRKKDIHSDIDEAYDLSGGDVEEDFLKDFDCESIHNAVNMLKDEYKQALTLKYFYDMKIDDIAKIIGITYDGTLKRIKRAEQSLYKTLSEMNYEQ